MAFEWFIDEDEAGKPNATTHEVVGEWTLCSASVVASFRGDAYNAWYYRNDRAIATECDSFEAGIAWCEEQHQVTLGR